MYIVVLFTNLGVDKWDRRWELRFHFSTHLTNRNTSYFKEDTLLASVGGSHCFRLEFNIPNKFLDPFMCDPFTVKHFTPGTVYLTSFQKQSVFQVKSSFPEEVLTR